MGGHQRRGLRPRLGASSISGHMPDKLGIVAADAVAALRAEAVAAAPWPDVIAAETALRAAAVLLAAVAAAEAMDEAMRSAVAALGRNEKAWLARRTG